MIPDFATLLRTYRVRAELSSNELAHRAFVDPSYVSRIEHQERDIPSRAIVIRLARALYLEGRDQARFFVSAGYWPDWPTDLADVMGAFVDAISLMDKPSSPAGGGTATTSGPIP